LTDTLQNTALIRLMKSVRIFVASVILLGSVKVCIDRSLVALHLLTAQARYLCRRRAIELSAPLKLIDLLRTDRSYYFVIFEDACGAIHADLLHACAAASHFSMSLA